MDIERERNGSPTSLDNVVGETEGGGASAFSVFQGRPRQTRRARRWTSSEEIPRRNESRRFWSVTMGMYQPPFPPSSGSTEATDNYVTNPMHRIDPAFLSPGDGIMHQSLHLSSRLPRRVWIILAKCLGIQLNENDKPIVATILHILTLTAAMTFAIPGGWYTAFDIKSQFSKTTVLIGSVQIIIGFAWACMGVYAHNLAGRLFHNRNFVACVRVHSKTFMKISTTWLTLFLGIGMLAVNCYVAEPIFYDDSCGTAEIEILVCQVFFVGRVAYAVMTLIWNFIVIYVLFSVCRTHTVGIRQLMRELNTDARWAEDHFLRQFHIERGDDEEIMNNLEASWYLWDDTGISAKDEDSSKHGVFLRSVNANSVSNLQTFSSNPRHRYSDSTSATYEDCREAWNGGGRGASVGSEGGPRVEATADRKPATPTNDQQDGPLHDGDESEEFSHCGEESNRRGFNVRLTNEDLLFTYWKFIRRLSVTSRYLQRWLSSWIAFVIIWDGYFIIFWTSHDAKLTDILQFVVPLLILLLVCSAYAEVNAEGQRLLKTVCPSEDRLAVIFYLNQYPLTIGVFSIPVTYNAVVTVMLAFSVAFASKLILDEIKE